MSWQPTTRATTDTNLHIHFWNYVWNIRKCCTPAGDFAILFVLVRNRNHFMQGYGHVQKVRCNDCPWVHKEDWIRNATVKSCDSATFLVKKFRAFRWHSWSSVTVGMNALYNNQSFQAHSHICLFSWIGKIKKNKAIHRSFFVAYLWRTIKQFLPA